MLEHASSRPALLTMSVITPNTDQELLGAAGGELSGITTTAATGTDTGAVGFLRFFFFLLLFPARLLAAACRAAVAAAAARQTRPRCPAWILVAAAANTAAQPWRSVCTKARSSSGVPAVALTSHGFPNKTWSWGDQPGLF